MDSVAENEVKLMVNTLPFELNENSFCSDSASRLRKIPPKMTFLIAYLNPIQWQLVDVISLLTIKFQVRLKDINPSAILQSMYNTFGKT